MTNQEDFIKKYFSEANQRIIEDLSRFLSFIDELAGNGSMEDLLQEKDFLCNAFYIAQTNGISRAHYVKVKRYLECLMEHYSVCAKVPTRQEVLEKQEAICYYDSLQGLWDFIDGVGYSKMSGYNKWADLVSLKVIVALGWHGVPFKEIAKLPKHCIRRDENQFWVILSESKEVEIDESTYKLISHFASLAGYRGLPSGRSISYNNDVQMLFRPTRLSYDFVRDVHIMEIIRRFNILPKADNRCINFGKLRKNAIFEKVYLDPSNLHTTAKIMKYAGCNYHVSFGYKAEYERWLKIYHPTNE